MSRRDCTIEQYLSAVYGPSRIEFEKYLSHHAPPSLRARQDIAIGRRKRAVSLVTAPWEEGDG